MSQSAPPAPRRMGARELIAEVMDAGSWVGWDDPPEQPRPEDAAYAAELAEATQRSGVDEATITGEGRIGARRVAVITGEFRFLAGSIGAVSAERIVRAFERARQERLPLFAAPSSGGTRMQEGTPAFVAMVKISAACAAFRADGLPYLVYLRHPTTGGVFASWGSLGHVTVAEPGGDDRVHGREGLRKPLRPAVPRRGADRGEPVRPWAGRCGAPGRGTGGDCRAVPRHRLRGPSGSAPGARPAARAAARVPAWESIERSRREDRPGVRALLKLGASDVLPLFGTGAGEWDRSMFLALATFDGAPCVVLGQDRRGQTLEKPLSPSGPRVARRGMNLARELDLPLVSVIDTAGATLSKEAEEGGMAGEIARCLAELVMLEEPTVCVLLGPGTSSPRWPAWTPPSDCTPG